MSDKFKLAGRQAVFTYPDYGTPVSHPEHKAHSGQLVTILRKLPIEEADGENAGKMYQVRAADGWEGCVFRDELRVKRIKLHCCFY